MKDILMVGSFSDALRSFSMETAIHATPEVASVFVQLNIVGRTCMQICSEHVALHGFDS
jgi:hypothetical protein